MIKSKKFTSEYFDKLVCFIKQAYPERNNIERSLKNVLYDIPEQENAHENTIIAINELDEIVGSFFQMPAKLLVNEKEISAFWGYDLVVLKKFRKTDAGTLLMEEYFKNKALFGIGLTKTAKNIYKRINIRFIGKSKAFFKPNFFTLNVIGLFSILLPQKKKYSFPDTLYVKKNKFERISCSEKLQINNDYWNNKIIEFSRSKIFIENRFLQFKEKYALYKLSSKINVNENDLYFVVCLMKYKNADILYVVDYRFNMSNVNELNLIINAISKLTRKLRLSGTLIRSSLDCFSVQLEKHFYFSKNSGGDIITNLSIDPNIPIFVTSADSDQDLPNRDGWFDYL